MIVKHISQSQCISVCLEKGRLITFLSLEIGPWLFTYNSSMIQWTIEHTFWLHKATLWAAMSVRIFQRKLERLMTFLSLVLELFLCHFFMIYTIKLRWSLCCIQHLYLSATMSASPSWKRLKQLITFLSVVKWHLFLFCNFSMNNPMNPLDSIQHHY